MQPQTEPSSNPDAGADSQAGRVARFGLLYFRRSLRCAWLMGGKEEDSPHICLDDGQRLSYPIRHILFDWLGREHEQPLEEAAPRELATEIERWQARPLTAALDTLYEHSHKEQPLDFDALAALALPADADGWCRAGLFRALLLDQRRFRNIDGAFLVRSAEAVHERDARVNHQAEQARWLEMALAWVEAREAGNRLPGPPEGFAAALESLLAHQGQSSRWKTLGKALHLSGENWPETRKRLKQLLEGAGAWRGWPQLWLRWAGVSAGFPPHLENAAAELAARAPVLGEREDCRDLHTVSIDTPGTQDIDDALSVLEVGEQSVTVALHVVEPPPELIPGAALFEEAARRMSSVYTWDGIYPMLPEALSCGRYSLLAGEEREVVTFRLVLNGGDGRLESITRSLLRVSENLDFAGGDALAQSGPEGWRRLDECCQAMAARRKAEGAIVPERYEVHIDRSDPSKLRLEGKLRSGAGSRMVEELAILLNREAGRYCRDHGLTAIYRVQQPRAKGSASGSRAARASTVHAPKLAAARFSLKGGPHRGVACDRYVQITSPMRRFADLLMIRQIAHHAATGKQAFEDAERMRAWLRRVEERLPVYAELGRRSADQWKRRYLAQNLAQNLDLTLEGRVTRVTGQSHGSAHLGTLDLQVRARLPARAQVGDTLIFRVGSVDLDLQEVWVEAVPG